MGKVIGWTTMTLDGVATVGEWYVSEGGHDQAAREVFERAAAMLLGRKSYEGFLGYWPEQEGPWADMLNPMPKYVASRTLEGPLEWNSTLIEGDLADGVNRLKEALEGDLMLVGCGELGAQRARGRPRGRAVFLGASGPVGRGRAAVRGRQAAADAPRLGDLRLRRHAPALRRRVARTIASCPGCRRERSRSSSRTSRTRRGSSTVSETSTPMVLSAHRKMVRAAFGAFDGIEMDTQGDAFFFVFPRARDAVAATVEAQRVHAASKWPGDESVRVRIGLHTGEPALHEEGYVGLDVVRAARICTEGRGGQILLSETTRSLVGSGLPEGVSVFPLGQRHLRGIDEPERVYEVAIDGLEQEEPEPSRSPSRASPPSAPAPPAPPAPPQEAALERDIEKRFEDFGERLSAAIQERVLQKLERKLERKGAPPRPPGDAADVDDIAARMESLGDEITARVNAALAKQGLTKEDP